MCGNAAWKTSSISIVRERPHGQTEVGGVGRNC
jgi:hypothetical protein